VWGLSRISGGTLGYRVLLIFLNQSSPGESLPSCTGESLLTYLQLIWRKAANGQAIQVKAISAVSPNSTTNTK